MSGYDETCSGFEIVFQVEKKSNYVSLVPWFVFDIEIRYIRPYLCNISMSQQS